MNGKSRAIRTGTDKSQGREGLGQDCSKQTGAKVEADLGRTKYMARKRHGRASEDSTGKDNAMEGHDRIMPKEDMAELVRGSSGQHFLALRVVIRLSRQDAVRTLLWHVSKVACC